VSVPQTYRYTKDHEWIDDPTGASAKVGITDFAANALGDIVFVDLPQVGDEVAAGTQCGEIESTKSVSSLFAPVSGSVTAVNEAVIDAPELVNEAPFGDGWLYQLAPDGSTGADLLDAAAYEATLAEAED